MSGPRVSLLNLSETARIIDDMAFWRATDENQEIVFERYNEGLGAKLANAGMWCFGYGQLGTYALEDNVSQVKVTAEKIRREATQTMEKRMLDGPASVRQYLDHCLKMKELSWKNVDFKSKEVARLNDEVKAAMDSRLRRTRIAKTVATASFTVGLSFVSAPIIVLVGAGVAYSTSCQIAESVSDIDASEMFGTVAGPLIREGLTSTGVNHGQSAIENVWQSQPNNRRMMQWLDTCAASIITWLKTKVANQLANRARQFARAYGKWKKPMRKQPSQMVAPNWLRAHLVR